MRTLCICNYCGEQFLPKTHNYKAIYCTPYCRGKMTGFKVGHRLLPGSEKGWIKPGQRLSPRTEFKKKTGKWMSKQGYIMVYSPRHPYKNSADGVCEHRLIVEEHIGRYLSKDEIIHHINGIKTDNRLNNLEIHSKRSHAQLHHDGRYYAAVLSK